MAPVAYVYHQVGLWGSFMGQIGASAFIKRFGMKSFMTHQDVGRHLTRFAPDLCKLMPGTTHSFLEWVCGPSNNISAERTPLFVRHTPAGTSVKNMVHWEQSLQQHTFGMHDEGSREANIKKYGTPQPPTYNLGDLNVPTALFTGDNDYFCHTLDVERLRREMKQGIEHCFHISENFSHLDFTWGVVSHMAVYQKILDVLTKHESENRRSLRGLLPAATESLTPMTRKYRDDKYVNPRDHHSCWSCLPKLCACLRSAVDLAASW